jgi:proprotein convertase subtilisin/kexin type 5
MDLTTDCASTCPDGYYPDSTDGICYKCYYRCAKCSEYDINNPTCDLCGGNRNNDASCSCDDGFYEKEIQSINCGACHSSCLTCSGPTAGNCETCRTNPKIQF